MWNLTSDDVQHAKDRINRRRAEIEARYAEERQALDAEDTMVEALARSAAEFALKYAGKAAAETPAASAAPGSQSEAQPEPPAETAAPQAAAVVAEAVVPAEASTAGDAKQGSRWRLHLGARPDGDGAIGAVATR
jgi:hypothetical protein